MKRIELLAPAGNMDALIGAINAGANAVYLGGKRFGARSYAANFELDEMREAISFAHLRDASVYVAVNTVVFDDEFHDLLETTDEIVKSGADALILQDLGLISLFSKRYPDTALHASTQTNTLSVDQAKVLKSLGIKRIILARETPIVTVKEIREKVQIEVEVFAHGALCVSYSGNCLFSQQIGGRSGNRGECAQTCRLPYELWKNEEMIEDKSYLMSPKDLMTIDHLDQLIDAGIDALKIEGRMRRTEYVVQSVLSYRKAIDCHYSGSPFDPSEEIDKLSRLFNREFTKGYLFNEKPNQLVNTKRPNHVGVPLGKVLRYERGKATVELFEVLRLDDGIRILGTKDVGTGVSRILKDNQPTSIAFPEEIVVLDVPEPVQEGAVVVKTLDRLLESELEVYLDHKRTMIRLDGIVHAITGEPFVIEATSSKGEHWRVESDFIVQKAMNQPSTEDNLRQHLSKLGNTPFEWTNLEIDTDGSGFIPVKVINESRRELEDRIVKSRTDRPAPRIIEEPDISILDTLVEQPQLIASVRTIDQYQAALESGVEVIYLSEIPNLDIDLSDERVYTRKRRIWAEHDAVANPRTVISDLGHLDSKSPEQTIVTDEFMNITNIHSIRLLHELGVRRITLSPEVKGSDIASIATKYLNEFGTSPNLEKVVYGREELMISKYCPIAKTYGTNPGCTLCERDLYSLKDRKGERYPLLNDGLCNIRILHSKTLVLIDQVAYILAHGVNSLRLNFTLESKEDTKRIITEYQKAIKGQPYHLSIPNGTDGRFLEKRS